MAANIKQLQNLILSFISLVTLFRKTVNINLQGYFITFNSIEIEKTAFLKKKS